MSDVLLPSGSHISTVYWWKICFHFQTQQCATCINLKMCYFNDDRYTIIPLSACVCIDEFCSTSVYGSDLSRLELDRFDLKTGFYGILSMQIVAASCMMLSDLSSHFILFQIKCGCSLMNTCSRSRCCHCIQRVYNTIHVCRTKPKRWSGVTRSHANVLPAWQPAVARSEGRHNQGTISEDWWRQTWHAGRSTLCWISRSPIS